jgi:DNA-binding NarL/FixJ family response regulator
VWEDQRWADLASSAVQPARDAGALGELPIPLTYLAAVHVHAGELDAAAALIAGADAITTVTGRELLATGETVREAGVLTAHETQVAQLTAAGHTNQEIGGQLVTSPRTVEYHLHDVFTKRGVSSRRELRAAVMPSSR